MRASSSPPTSQLDVRAPPMQQRMRRFFHVSLPLAWWPTLKDHQQIRPGSSWGTGLGKSCLLRRLAGLSPVLGLPPPALKWSRELTSACPNQKHPSSSHHCRRRWVSAFHFARCPHTSTSTQLATATKLYPHLRWFAAQRRPGRLAGPSQPYTSSLVPHPRNRSGMRSVLAK